jgi:hypothetical protein
VTKLAIGFCCLLLGRVVRFYPVNTLVIDLYYFFVGKLLLGERRLYVAHVGTIDFFGHGVMRNFLDVRVTVSARDVSVHTAVITSLVHVIVYPLAAFVNSANETIFMAHQTIFFVFSFGGKPNRKDDKGEHKA